MSKISLLHCITQKYGWLKPVEEEVFGSEACTQTDWSIVLSINISIALVLMSKMTWTLGCKLLFACCCGDASILFVCHSGTGVDPVNSERFDLSKTGVKVAMSLSSCLLCFLLVSLSNSYRLH